MFLYNEQGLGNVWCTEFQRSHFSSHVERKKADFRHDHTRVLFDIIDEFSWNLAYTSYHL
jgi:hypothetical protein